MKQRGDYCLNLARCLKTPSEGFFDLSSLKRLSGQFRQLLTEQMIHLAGFLAKGFECLAFLGRFMSGKGHSCFQRHDIGSQEFADRSDQGNIARSTGCCRGDVAACIVHDATRPKIGFPVRIAQHLGKDARSFG